MKSIQTKILVVVIAGLIIMTTAISVICFGTMHDILHKDADRILDNRCKMEAAQINDIMNNITKSISVMEHYASTELFSPDALKIEKYREDYLQKMENMFDEIALNTEGIVGYYFRIIPEFSDYQTGFFTGITIDNGEKKLVYHTPTDISKYDKNDVSNVGWYYTAIEAEKGTWMQPYKNHSTNKWIVSYVSPIFVKDTVVATIGMDIDFSYFLEYVNNISLYESGNAVMLSPDSKHYYAEESVKEIEDSVNSSAVSKIALENGMYLQLNANYKEIQSELRPILYQVLAVFIIIMAIFILYSVIVTQKIVAPLKKLTTAAENILDGKNDIELPKNSKDEIGTLSVVLSNTYQKLTEYMNYINALAYRDSLTGIKNATAYSEVVQKIDNEINHSNPAFAVLVIDINNLKKTNDIYGHDIGNELIRHTANILCDTFRTSAVYRIGGDEFVVILENNDLKNYRSLIEKLDIVCSEDYVSFNDESIPVSIARGVAVYSPNIDKVYTDVFNNADHAMYMHKQEVKKAIV